MSELCASFNCSVFITYFKRLYMVLFLTRYNSVGQGSNQRVMRHIGQPIFDALIAYDDGQYELVVEKLLPLRYEVTDGILSGSRAQVLFTTID
jgi:hypothetical protein